MSESVELLPPVVDPLSESPLLGVESLPESDSELLLFPVSEPEPESEPVPEPEFPGFFPALPVAFSEVFSPFLSTAVTLLPSLILFAGIVTVPLVLSTVTPSGVSPVQFPSLPFLTVMVFSLSSPSGVYVITRVSVSFAGVIVAEP